MNAGTDSETAGALMLKSNRSKVQITFTGSGAKDEGQERTIVTAGTGTTSAPASHGPCVVGSNGLLGLDQFRSGLAPQVSSLGRGEEGDGGDERELHFCFVCGYGLEDREEASGRSGEND